MHAVHACSAALPHAHLHTPQTRGSSRCTRGRTRPAEGSTGQGRGRGRIRPAKAAHTCQAGRQAHGLPCWLHDAALSDRRTLGRRNTPFYIADARAPRVRGVRTAPPSRRQHRVGLGRVRPPSRHQHLRVVRQRRQLLVQRDVHLLGRARKDPAQARQGRVVARRTAAAPLCMHVTFPSTTLLANFMS